MTLAVELKPQSLISKFDMAGELVFLCLDMFARFAKHVVSCFSFSLEKRSTHRPPHRGMDRRLHRPEERKMAQISHGHVGKSLEPRKKVSVCFCFALMKTFVLR